nr:immunoglobulin heavy chain junction region [Mus musculus]MBK4198391.1 immunoglobulin heavy chain junction region [Mus musculus]
CARETVDWYFDVW